VILDDLIVDGSICTGLDCVNGESFGFDTLRLKENNLRIKFQDTSASASFPTVDWQITANDSSNGGLNKFSIDEIDGGRTPFTVEAGARTNSLYVEADGDIGIGTSNPVVDVHVLSGNTPTLRLDQDGSSGFTPQIWDVAGNEANFFIRDATSGSKLPFKIFPNAPTNALIVEGTTGNIGLGIQNPEEHLHVHSTDGSAQVYIEDINGTAAARTMLRMANKGNTKFTIINTEASTEWSFANPGDAFRVSRQGSGVVELELDNSGNMTIAGNGATKFSIDNQAAGTEWGLANAGDSTRLSKQGSGDVEMELFGNGNMTIAGTLTENSDVNSKTAITRIDPAEILEQVSALPISKWEYKDARGEAHIGPMAQDFYSAFGLGGTETGISTIDTAGVALAAIQALAAKNRSLELAVAELQRENKALAASQQEKLERVDRLEQLVQLLVQAGQEKPVLTSIDQ
jgi:hypothetical protein